MEVCPDGRVGYALSPHGSADYGAEYHEKRAAGRLVALEPPLGRISPESLAMAGPEGRPDALLHAGFRTLHACHGRPGHLEFTVPSGGPGGTSRERVPLDLSRERPPRLHMGATKGSFDACVYLEGEMEMNMWPWEDRLCLDALGSLGGGHEFCYGPQSTLDTLAGFVRDLNSGRPGAIHFDTVFMDIGMHMRLFGQDRRTYGRLGDPSAYENLVQMRGMTFLHPKGMQATDAFVTSSSQGPIFVNGPHTTRCTSSGLDVTHHCALVGPPGQGDPDLPWGVRIAPRFRQ